MFFWNIKNKNEYKDSCRCRDKDKNKDRCKYKIICNILHNQINKSFKYYKKSP